MIKIQQYKIFMQASEDSNFINTKNYFKMFLKLNGMKLSRFQHTHIMVVYFLTYGLDITSSLTTQQIDTIREYILSLQIPSGGWTCCSFYTKYEAEHKKFDLPHIVFTYSALNTLSSLGGLEKVNKQLCLESIRKCEQPDGSFSNFQNSDEADLRFVYSAVSVCHTLGDFSKINVQKIVAYIQSCYNFDGGYGLRPSCESHSGAIYCALASLKMLGKKSKEPKRTLNFLVNRQVANLSSQQYVGVQGRVGKHPDSCYGFWVGASIKILSGQNLLNPKVQNFIKLCYKQHQGSFSKYPQMKTGDPLHTVHSLIGIKIAQNKLNELELQKGIMKHDKN